MLYVFTRIPGQSWVPAYAGETLEDIEWFAEHAHKEGKQVEIYRLQAESGMPTEAAFKFER